MYIYYKYMCVCRCTYVYIELPITTIVWLCITFDKALLYRDYHGYYYYYKMSTKLQENTFAGVHM